MSFTYVCVQLDRDIQNSQHRLALPLLSLYFPQRRSLLWLQPSVHLEWYQLSQSCSWFGCPDVLGSVNSALWAIYHGLNFSLQISRIPKSGAHLNVHHSLACLDTVLSIGLNSRHCTISHGFLLTQPRTPPLLSQKINARPLPNCPWPKHPIGAWKIWTERNA